MEPSPSLQVSEELRIARLPLVVPVDEMRQHMEPALRELYATVLGQGLAIAGPWFTHHRRRPTDTFDFALCVPVDGDVHPRGRVEPATLPSRRVACVMHDGPYERLHEGWAALHIWLARERLTPAADLWEIYHLGPDHSTDSADFRTELVQPLQSLQ